MRQKMNHESDSVRDGRGIRHLLIIQLGVLSLCVWLGLVLHYFRDAGIFMIAGMLLLAFNAFILAALGLPRSMRRFTGSLMLAIGLMYLLNLSLPPAWADGQAFLMLTLLCAALAVWLTGQTAPREPRAG